MSRGKPKSHETGIRTCIVTGEKRHQSELVKFITDPQGNIVPDIFGKLPGRGLWMYCTSNNLERAIAKNIFSRAARKHIEIPDNLLYKVECGLVERLVGLLAIARKSGLLIAGFERVQSEVRANKIIILFHGSDGSERQFSKIITAQRQFHVFNCLSSTEQGKVLGKDIVMYLGVRPGGLIEGISLAARRLSVMRSV